MGADLYLESINNKAREKWNPLFEAACRKRDALPDGPEKDAAQREVTDIYCKMFSGNAGYFRDSYNGAGIAAQLGFSWWTDVIPMLDENGYLQPPKIQEFLDRIKDAKIRTPTFAELKEAHCKVDNEDNTPESWRESWEKNKQELIAFLGMALDRNEPIFCSL